MSLDKEHLIGIVTKATTPTKEAALEDQAPGQIAKNVILHCPNAQYLRDGLISFEKNCLNQIMSAAAKIGYHLYLTEY